MALFLLGDAEQAWSVLRTGAEHPADQPARVTLLWLHAVASWAGVAVPESESDEAITQLGASPMPGMSAGGLWLQAMLVADGDAPAAIALYQQTIDADTGSLALEESCRNFQLGLISRTDDVEAALEGFTHVLNAWQTRTGSTWTTGGIQEVAFWLARLGYHDGAARIYGARTWGLSFPPEILTLPELMGESAYTAAFNAGAALDHRAVGELALELIEQVRRDQTGD